MRLLRLAVQWRLLVPVGTSASVAVFVTGALASTSRPAAPTETVTVYPTNANPTPSEQPLVRSHRYRIKVSGTVSDWCGEDAKSKEDCDFNGLPGTFEKGKGVDALYCYVKWRCPTPQLWRQLRINGKGFDEFVGKAGQIPYSGSNSYTEEVGGIAGKLSFVSSDSSPSNDSGKWTVEITDLGEKEGECGPSREPNRHMAVNEVRVVSIVPEVQYHKENGPANEWCPLDKTVVLHQGDELQCDPEGSVVLAFADNSTVVVRNTTQLKIAAFFTEASSGRRSC